MYALPHQVEYLTDAWLGEAERYLQRELTAGRLAAVGPFSLSQRATDTPPHLGFADGLAAWSACFDGERLAVARIGRDHTRFPHMQHLHRFTDSRTAALPAGATGAVDGGLADGAAG